MKIYRSICLGLFISAAMLLQNCSGNKTNQHQPVSALVNGHPAWSAQSNIYEVNLRQYTKEGTINAFENELPRLKDMGVEILWFMPVTPIGLKGRKMTESDMGSYYAVQNYQAFNPDYGTMEDWKRFVKHAQDMGFKVITDWVANHSAPDNVWVTTHPQFYAKDSAGNMIAPFDWTDVRKLDYNNRELRDSMIAAMKYWLMETNIDGFRCDVAEEVPADFWKACIDTLRKIKPVFMLAEGEKPALHEAGFDETYAWNMMHVTEELYKGKISLNQFYSNLNAGIKRFPKNAYRMYFTANHDENSWNGTEFEKYGDAYKTFALFSQTMYQSVPLIYSGQEDMNKKRLKFFVKDTIAWDGKNDMAPFYKTLLTLRKSNEALAADASYKRLATTANNSIFAYSREKNGHKVIVILNLSPNPTVFSVTDVTVNGNPVNVFTGGQENTSTNTRFTLQPWGYRLFSYN
jgi:alpha-amylase